MGQAGAGTAFFAARLRVVFLAVFLAAVFLLVLRTFAAFSLTSGHGVPPPGVSIASLTASSEPRDSKKPSEPLAI